MAEKTRKVHNIIHPSPVSLKELSAIAATLELWRTEINECRKNLTSERFLLCVSGMPLLPSVLYDTMLEYATRLGNSILNWLTEHSLALFYNDILKDFDDLVCDFFGEIHYVRTAERMMRCDKFNEITKFYIACTYCFEDDIRRIWPSVCGKVDLQGIDFNSQPYLYYWICYCKDQLNKIPIEWHDTVDEEMLGKSCVQMRRNTSALNYFWNRVPYENRTRVVLEFFLYDKPHFVMFVLPKLDDRQLENFVNQNGRRLMQAMLKDSFCDKRFVIQTWMYIRNTMNGSTFSNLVVKMLKTEAKYCFSQIDHHEFEKWLRLSCVIWNSAPDNLKRSAIADISSDSQLTICPDGYIDFSSSKFLLTVLSHCTRQEKQSFWSNCWNNFLLRKSMSDLQQIMETCFEHEDELVKFKENVIAKNEKILHHCVSLLKLASFSQLDNLVNFCCPRNRGESAKDLKQRVLRSSFLGENSDFNSKHILHGDQLNRLINDAYDSVDLANDFKHQLMSSSDIPWTIMFSAVSTSLSYESLIKFIEMVSPTEETVRKMKSFIIDRLKEGIAGDSSATRHAKRKRSSYITHHVSVVRRANYKPCFDEFLLWCLGSDEKVVEFRRTYIDPCLE